ncbi:unnamed protein product [Ectocarpus sp. 12 AP-2014]
MLLLLLLLEIVFVLCAASTVGASSQRKYDGSTLSYDPKGRIYQVEYAMEATRRGSTVLGVCGGGCVALVTRDPSPPMSSCRAAGPQEGVWAVDAHVGIAACGLRSDIQYVVDCARTWCSEHRFIYGGPMPCQMLSRRLADLIHSWTTRGGKRPLAVDILVGGVDDHAGASLHRVQATGAFQRYRAFAAGGGGAAATARLAAAAEKAAEAREEQDDDDDGLRQASDDAVPGYPPVETRQGVPVDATTTSADGASSGEDGGRGDAEDSATPAGGGSGSGGGGGGDGGSAEGEKSHGGEAATRGGLRAAELTAAVYRIQRQASVESPKEEGGGGESLGDPVGDAVLGGGEGEGAWEQGVGCAREELESILLELEAEDETTSRGNRL